ncbi:MAG: PIG-L family deacetylase [Candidatus Omnitrophica bacterium]|nr:PIG-L family deacetylase [Candidatus Omnitrophota bacterium]
MTRIHKEDRALVAAAHPDDETLGAGGIIQRVLKTGARVKVIYLTHGDHNEIASLFYQGRPMLTKSDFIRSGKIRKGEALQAMRGLGLEAEDLVFLGYPDLGLLPIWNKHRGKDKPFRSFLTRMNRVPYKEDFSYGKLYKAENIVSDLKRILDGYKPTRVFVPAIFDAHPDHQAVYLYVNAALADGGGPRPAVHLYLVHAPRWPDPRGERPHLRLEEPLHCAWAGEWEWFSFDLAPDEIEGKRKALLCYKSQMAYSRNFLLSFVRSNELFAKKRKDGS